MNIQNSYITALRMFSHIIFMHLVLTVAIKSVCFFFTLEFCCGFYLEDDSLPPAKPPSKPTLNCSKQKGGDRCFLTCQSQVQISSGEWIETVLTESH